MSPSCCENLSSLADGDKQLILRSLPLNHHRRRGHSEATSLKELQWKLRRWKTTWRTWWKSDICVVYCVNVRKVTASSSSHRSDVFSSLTHKLHVRHHSLAHSLTRSLGLWHILFLSIHQLLHLSPAHTQRCVSVFTSSNLLHHQRLAAKIHRTLFVASFSSCFLSASFK